MTDRPRKWSTPEQRRKRVAKVQEQRAEERRGFESVGEARKEFSVRVHDAAIRYITLTAPARVLLPEVLLSWSATSGQFRFVPVPEAVACQPEDVRKWMLVGSAIDEQVKLDARDIAKIRDAFALRSRREESVLSRVAFHRMYLLLDRWIREEEAVQRRLSSD